MLNQRDFVSHVLLLALYISIVDLALELLLHQMANILSVANPPSTNTPDKFIRAYCILARVSSVTDAEVLPAEQVSFPPPELP